MRFRAILVGACGAALLLAGCGSTVDGTASKAADVSAVSTSDVQSSSPSSTSQSSPSSGPTSTAPDGAFRVSASPDPRVVVTVIEDMGCPACKLFQASYGSVLEQISALPGAAVDYRIISFLDRMSADEYSSRAANASYCVWNRPGSDADRQRVWSRFQTAAFRDQPAEGGKGLSDDELLALAKSAGATDVSACITSGRYRSDVEKNSTRTTSDRSFEGTPTVLLNGESVELGDLSTLLDKVKKELGR